MKITGIAFIAITLFVNILYVNTLISGSKKYIQDNAISSLVAAVKIYDSYKYSAFSTSKTNMETLPPDNHKNKVFFEDFDSENVTTTNYTKIVPFFSNIKPNSFGWYWVTNHPGKLHKTWTCNPIAPNDKFLMLDGALKPSTLAFCLKKAIKKNKVYNLNFKLASASLNKGTSDSIPVWQVANLLIQINTDSFYVIAPNRLHYWKNVSINFKQPTDTLHLKIIDLNTSNMYNDFAMDKISVSEISNNQPLTAKGSGKLHIDTGNALNYSKMKLFKQMLNDELFYKKLDLNYELVFSNNQNAFTFNAKGEKQILASAEEYEERLKSPASRPNGIYSGSIGLNDELAVKIIVNDVLYTAAARIKYSLLFQLLLLISVVFLYILSYKLVVVQQNDLLFRNQMNENITHELKTPVTTIIASLEAIKLIKDDQKKEVFIQGAIQQAFKINELINKALQLSSLDANQIIINLQKINPVLIINKVVTERYGNQKNNIQVIDYRPNREASVNTDAFHFENIVNLLIDNAIKYTQDSFNLKIVLDKTPHSTSISFIDQGIGISKAYLNLIFKRYFRAPDLNYKIKGYGLGLNYAKQVLKKQNADITVGSELNKGTTFNVIFKD